MKELSDEFWDELEKPPEQHIFCGTPTLSKQEIEWREENYNRDNWVETFPCAFCGCCPNPGQCVRSVTCPICWRSPGYSCVQPTDATAVAPYHEARWQVVNKEFGVYYK